MKKTTYWRWLLIPGLSFRGQPISAKYRNGRLILDQSDRPKDHNKNYANMFWDVEGLAYLEFSLRSQL